MSWLFTRVYWLAGWCGCWFYCPPAWGLFAVMFGECWWLFLILIFTYPCIYLYYTEYAKGASHSLLSVLTQSYIDKIQNLELPGSAVKHKKKSLWLILLNASNFKANSWRALWPIDIVGQYWVGRLPWQMHLLVTAQSRRV